MKLTKLIKMPALKKLALSVLIALYLFVSLAVYIPRKTQAIGPWYHQDFVQWYTKVYDPGTPSGEIFGERYTAAQVQWVFFGIIGMIIPDEAAGCIGQDIATCLTSLDDIARDLYSQDNQTTFLASIGLGDEVPDDTLSGIGYARQSINNLKIVPEVQAQQGGFGYNELTLVQPLWTIVRNMAYALSVFVIVVMAFMIMFRVKISPQTIVTVQSALPKLFIALILMTFSYAIAGLLYDLMHVVFGLISLFLATAGPPDLSAATPNEIFNVFMNYTAPGMILTYFFLFLALIVIGILIPVINIVTGPVFGVVFGLLALIMLITLIRVWWMLLRTYVSILFLIILAPLHILLGTISPNVSFGSWLRNMIANLAVFPVVGIMLVISHIFFWGSAGWRATSINFLGLNPFRIQQDVMSGDIRFPLLGTGGATGFGTIGFIASFIIIFMLPSVANMIKAAIQGQPFNYGTAIGQTLRQPYDLGRAGLSAADPTIRGRSAIAGSAPIWRRLDDLNRVLATLGQIRRR